MEGPGSWDRQQVDIQSALPHIVARSPPAAAVEVGPPDEWGGFGGGARLAGDMNMAGPPDGAYGSRPPCRFILHRQVKWQPRRCGYESQTGSQLSLPLCDGLARGPGVRVGPQRGLPSQQVNGLPAHHVMSHDKSFF